MFMRAMRSYAIYAGPLVPIKTNAQISFLSIEKY